MTYSTTPNHITPGLLRVLQALYRLLEDYGQPPTLRELADALGLSAVSTVHRHLLALARLGLVQGEMCSSRSYRITRAGWRMLGDGAARASASNLLADARSVLAALDEERIDHPYAGCLRALDDITESLEVPA